MDAGTPVDAPLAISPPAESSRTPDQLTHGSFFVHYLWGGGYLNILHFTAREPAVSCARRKRDEGCEVKLWEMLQVSPDADRPLWKGHPVLF